MPRGVPCVAAALLLLVGGRAPPPAAQEALPDSVSSAGGDQRPAFLLPDIVVEGEDLSRLTGGARLSVLEAPTVQPAEQPTVMPPAPTRYRRRASTPFHVGLPTQRPLERPRAALRAVLGADAERKLSALWMPSPGALVWIDDQAWDGRIADRSHEQVEAGVLFARPAAEPTLRGGVSLVGGWESWDAGAREGACLEPGSVEAPQGELFLEQALGRGAAGAVISLRAAAARSRVEICRDSACERARVRRTAGWQRVAIGLQRRGTPRDLRLLASPGERVPVARRLEVDLQGGVVRRENGFEPAVERACGIGRIGWTFPAYGGLLTAGIAGGGEGDAEQSLLGPYLTYQRADPERGLLLAVEIAPEIRFAELEELGAAPFESFATQDIARSLAMPAPLPLLRDPTLPAQRAWPRIHGECLVRGTAGWLQTRATVAAVRDPFDWSTDSLAAGPELVASARGADRWLATVGLQGETRWAGGVRLRGRYRWVHDAEPEAGAVLAWLPAHELRTALEGRWGALRAGASLIARSRMESEATGEAVAGWTQLDLRVGWCFRTHTLHLVGANISAQEVAWWPGETSDDAWWGIQWDLAIDDAVP